MAYSVVQVKAVTGTLPITVTLDASPTAGNVLVAFEATEGILQIAGTATWDQLVGYTPGVVTEFRVVDPGDPAAWTFDGTAGADSRVYLVEFTGFVNPSASAVTGASDGTGTTASFAIAGPGLLVAGAMFETAGAPATPLSGVTELNEAAITTVTLWAGWREIDAGTYYIGATIGSADWQICGMVIAETDVPAYVDWDSDLISWTITRGSGAEITSPTNPGSCTLVLKNSIAAGAASDDRYNPYNASGPYYGVLTDGLPVWVGVNADGSLGSPDKGLFAGRVTDISLIPSPGTSVASTVETVAEDALGWYSRTPVKIDYAEGRSHGALRLAALTAGGETRYDLASEITTMQLSHADGDLGAVLAAINAANGTRHFIKPADTSTAWYDYTTRNRQWRLDATVDATLDAAADHVTGTPGWRLSADTVINQQKATSTPVVFTPATFTVWESSDLPIELDDTHPYTRIVGFDDYVADATLDIASTGDTVNQTFTPFATGGKVELSVGAGDTATVSALSIEGSLARYAPTESYEANDFTSQALPRGIRAGSEIGGEYVGSLASAAGIAEHVVWRYGNPQLRPTLTVENWLPDQFDLDLYDIISFTSTHLGMTDRLFEIVGLTHEGNVAASASVHHHVTTYVLQECKVQADPGWFILDTSELDSADILAY